MGASASGRGQSVKGTGRLYCPETGEEAALDCRDLQSPGGGLWEVDWGALNPPSKDSLAARRPGLWRFRELVDPELPEDEIVTLAEGDTPLLESPRLAAWTGLESLHIKHEGRNPTGSFKDRGMTVAVSRARLGGACVLACASTGNTAASLAAYAGRAGLASAVLVPAGKTASGKLSQAVAHGARVLSIRGDFDDAMRLARSLAGEGSVTLLNSANPFRVEGQKTILYEIIEAFCWSPPDWFVFPAGNLGNAAAFGKACRELLALGWIDTLPRLAAVQARGAAPFATSYERGFAPLEPVNAETIATAIRIGDPVSFSRAVRALEETDGVVLAVEDEQILEAKAAVDACGLGAEPASCASVAGVRELVRQGLVRPGERVVALLTGHLLKDPETTLAYHEGSLGAGGGTGTLREVPAEIEALREAIQG